MPALPDSSAHPASPAAGRSRLDGWEWPTWLLIGCIYGLWWGALAWYGNAQAPAALVLLVLVSAWYISLQHELVHGHPSPWPWLNRWLGMAPLAVWYPFDIYRVSHLAHHRDELLTYPDQDPESNYTEPQDFAKHNALLRALLVAQRTALGRFFISPAFGIFRLLRPLFTRSYWADPVLRWAWLQHGALLALMLWAVQAYSGISPALYLLLSYFCLGLAFMRSFYEHRPAANPQHRIVINEAGLLWRLLYLNNNYHAVHHAQAGLPWYRIPALYWQERAHFLQQNGGFLIQGYGRFFLRHALRPIDAPGQPTRDLPAPPPA